MKVFVAGATGAIGRRLVPMLVSAGYTVTGTTRTREKAESIARMGAAAAVVDALNGEQVLEAVRQAEPDVIIDELTAIPANLNLRRFDAEFAMTNRLRSEGTDLLLAAARSVGCRRFIAQSYAGWPYSRVGGWIKTEEDPLIPSPHSAMRKSLEAILHLEAAVLGDRTIEGFVLRYGSLYGPGTSLGRGGSLLWHVKRRRLPVIGKGTGHWSFVHIDDAAAATLAAVEAAAPGLYNVTDDEPAPVSEWLPFLADAVGAKAPRRIPSRLGRVLIGPHGVAMMNENRGASNQKAKSLLGWKLKWPTWREGFSKGLGDETRQAASQSKSPAVG